MTALFILERTLPDGRKRQHDPLSRRKAATAAFFVLTDNYAADPRSATRVARELEDSPTGTEVGAAGYVFRLIEA